jgi:putative Holliday junction resolvase
MEMLASAVSSAEPGHGDAARESISTFRRRMKTDTMLSACKEAEGLWNREHTAGTSVPHADSRWQSSAGCVTILAMRYLGVDLGTKRIGLALAEPGGGVVSPLRVIEAKPQAVGNARAILEVADEYAADAIVIGLPLNMDGTEGPQVKLSKLLAGEIRKLCSLPVHLHDERLTSHAADGRLVDRGLTHKGKKARHDAIAAQILLESFLDSLGGPA